MKPIQVRQVMTEDGEVLVTGLPCKKGEAVEITISARPGVRTHLTVEAFRRSGLIGMWEDRQDIGDSSEFARRIRAEAESRGNWLRFCSISSRK